MEDPLVAEPAPEPEPEKKDDDDFWATFGSKKDKKKKKGKNADPEPEPVEEFQEPEVSSLHVTQSISNTTAICGLLMLLFLRLT